MPEAANSREINSKWSFPSRNANMPPCKEERPFSHWAPGPIELTFRSSVSSSSFSIFGNASESCWQPSSPRRCSIGGDDSHGSCRHIQARAAIYSVRTQPCSLSIPPVLYFFSMRDEAEPRLLSIRSLIPEIQNDLSPAATTSSARAEASIDGYTSTHRKVHAQPTRELWNRL